MFKFLDEDLLAKLMSLITNTGAKIWFIREFEFIDSMRTNKMMVQKFSC